MTFRLAAILALWTMLSGPVFSPPSRQVTPSLSSSAEGKNVSIQARSEKENADYAEPAEVQFGGMALFLRQQLHALGNGEI